MTRFIPFVIAVALCACASELHTSSQLDAAATKTETAHAEQHAQAQDHVEDHSAERTAENVVTTTAGGAIDFDGVITKPDGTKLDGHFHRAPVKVKRDARKTAAVQKAISADASSLLDASSDTAAKTVSTVKAKSEKAKESKPSLGFLAALTPYLFAAGAVLALLLFAWLTHGNPVAIAGKVLAWLVAKVRGQPSAG